MSWASHRLAQVLTMQAICDTLSIQDDLVGTNRSGGATGAGVSAYTGYEFHVS